MSRPPTWVCKRAFYSSFGQSALPRKANGPVMGTEHPEVQQRGPARAPSPLRPRGKWGNPALHPPSRLHTHCTHLPLCFSCPGMGKEMLLCRGKTPQQFKTSIIIVPSSSDEGGTGNSEHILWQKFQFIYRFLPFE